MDPKRGWGGVIYLEGRGKGMNDSVNIAVPALTLLG